MSKFIVGLTGGIGSGKSTVANAFAKLGVDVIDADQLARDVVEPGRPALEKIAAHFGESILDEHGALRRKMLREIVFENLEEKNWLETLLHPLIAEEIKSRIATAQSNYCILESPLLLETSQKSLVHRILVVDVDEPIQIDRAMRRDGSSEQTIRAIIASQISRDLRLQNADDVIENDCPIEAIQAKVESFHQKYVSLANAHEQS